MIAWSHLSSAGFTIRGEHSNPSGKPVIHFLHGNGYCGRTYWPMLELLQPDFDIFISDLQGHGDTDHGGEFRGWNRSAELAAEAWSSQAHKFESVPQFAVGHSFGGVLTSLMLAHQPARFKRAVLLDPVLFSPVMLTSMALLQRVGLLKRTALAQKARQRKSRWPDRATAYASLNGRGMFKGWAHDALQAYIDHALRDAAPDGVELKCHPHREAEVFSSFPQRLWTALKHVQVPIKVDFAEQSFPFVAKSVQRWLAINGQVVAEKVAGNHCFMQQDPALAARRIKDFLLR